MWREYFRISWRALWAHRFRSSLTVLSLMEGAFAIVVMSSLAKSGLATLRHALEEIGGARVIFIVPKAADPLESRRYSKGTTVEDATALFERVPHLAARTTMVQLRRKDALNEAGDAVRADGLAGDENTL